MTLYFPLILLVICVGCSRQQEKETLRKSATNNFVASLNVKSSALNHSTSKSGDPAPTFTFDMAEVERLTAGFAEETELITKIKAGIPLSSNELIELINAYNGKQEQLLNIMRDGYYWQRTTASLYLDYLHMATGLATEAGPIFYKAELADAYDHFGTPENTKRLLAMADELDNPNINDFTSKAKFLRECGSYGNIQRAAASRVMYKNPEKAAEMYLKAVSTEHKSFLPPMLDAAKMYRMADKTEKAIEILTELVNMPAEKKYIVPDITDEGKPMTEKIRTILIALSDQAVEEGKIMLENFKHYHLLEQKEYISQ